MTASPTDTAVSDRVADEDELTLYSDDSAALDRLAALEAETKANGPLEGIDHYEILILAQLRFYMDLPVTARQIGPAAFGTIMSHYPFDAHFVLAWQRVQRLLGR